MTTQRHLYEQDDELKVPALLDEDPVSREHFPLPEPRVWEPKPERRGFFAGLMERVGL